MSETTPSPSTPEAGRIAPPDIDGVPAHLQPAELEALRKKQHTELNSRLMSLGQGEKLSDDDEHAMHEKIIEEHLEASGIAPGSPEYEAHKALLTETAIDSIYEKDWYNEQTVDGETKPARRDEIFQRLESDHKIDAEPDAGIYISPEEKEEIAKQSKKYAKLLAERSKKAGLFEAKGAVAEREDAKRILAELISDAAANLRQELTEAGVAQEKITAELSGFIQSEMAHLLVNLEEARSASFTERSRFTQGALKKWASWQSPEDATWRQRIFSVNTLKKGAVFAVPGAVLGAAGGIVAGGALAGAAGVLLARSIARNLAGVKLDNAANSETLATAQREELQQRMAASESQVHHDLIELAELQAAEIHSVNRKRLIGGTAISLATAGLFSGVGALVGSELAFGKAGQGVKQVLDVPKPSGEATKELTLDDPWNPPDRPPVPDVPSHQEVVDQYVDNHDTGTTVTKGEGWYNTFKEFGVTSSNRDDLLKEVGPQLEKMGEAYRTEDGLWGISRPGELSDDASRLIVDTANEHGWLANNLDATTAVEAAPEALREVKAGEGILQTLKDAGVENPTLADVSAVQDQLVADAAAYANGPSGYAGLNLNGGTMNEAGINTVTDYADNKQLDGSNVVNAESHIVGSGEDAVNYDTLTGIEQAGNDHLTYLEATEMNNDIHQMSDLIRNGNIEVINSNPDYQNALHYVYQDLKGVNYPGTDTPVIEARYSMGGEQWKFNPVPPNSHLPARALNTMIAYEQSKFALAS